MVFRRSLLTGLFWAGSLGAGFAQDAPPEQRTPQGLYDQGDYRGAAGLFLEQAREETDPSRRSLLLYNGARSLQEGAAASPELLPEAIDLYYRALDWDSANRAAAHNLELARKEQMARERQDSSSGQGESEEEAPRELADRQKELSQRQDQGDASHREEQEALREETRQRRGEAGNSQEEEALDRALEKQEDALEQMQKGRPEEARRAQEEAARLLQQADSSSEEEPPQDEGAPGQSDASAEEDREIRDILQEEQLRRERKSQDIREDYGRVERNW